MEKDRISRATCSKVSCKSMIWSMDEGRERDKTSRGGGLPTLPSLYTSVQFSLRNEGSSEYICVCEGRESLRPNF
jgi:hypothetical protein